MRRAVRTTAPPAPPQPGALTSVDIDNDATFTTVASGASANGYGTFAMTSDGHWTFTVNNNNATVQALNVGGTLIDTFTVTSIDGTQQVISVTIHGADDAMVITGDTSGAITEQGGVNNGTGAGSITGVVNATDVDSPSPSFTAVVAATATSGGYGTYTLTAGGSWTYTLDNSKAAVQALNVGEDLTDSFTVVTTDGTSKVVNITIHGANDAAVLSSDTKSLTEGDTSAAISTGGQLTISDVDSSATFVAQAGTAGSYGTFAIGADGQWTYTASSAHDEFVAGQHYVENFDVVSADGTHTNVHIDITGSQDPVVGPTDADATANAVNENAVGGTLVGITASATDVDQGATITYSLSSNPGNLFAIDAVTGIVTVANGAIINTRQRKAVRSRCWPTSSDGSSNSQTFDIAVNDLDEAAPTITSGATAAAVNENVPVGTLVYTAAATDTGDVSGGVTFSLKAGEGDFSAFTIDAVTGQVTLNESPNFEQPRQSYSFTVVATDAAGNHDEQQVTLAVNNLDEVAPVITSLGAANAIDENLPAGTLVYTVTATDFGDISGGVTFSLKADEGDDSAFTIDPVSGQVKLAGPSDHEAFPNYTFTVVATDAAGHAVEKIVTSGCQRPRRSRADHNVGRDGRNDKRE